MAFCVESPARGAYLAGVTDETQDYEARFGGVRRLLGTAALERLRRAHVCVVGLGGVGSWAVEALARTGVGALTLVDFDRVAVSNVNRQLPALTGQFGRPKAEALAERVQAIQPVCAVRGMQVELLPETIGEVLAVRYDAVLDAIDRPALKALLIAGCRLRGLPVVASGGAGGQADPTRIRVDDLARVTHDRLLQATRRVLRQEHGLPGAPEVEFGVRCVYCAAPPLEAAGDAGENTGSGEATAQAGVRHPYGTVCFVTGAFGFVAAAEIVRLITGRPSGC